MEEAFIVELEPAGAGKDDGWKRPYRWCGAAMEDATPPSFTLDLAPADLVAFLDPESPTAQRPEDLQDRLAAAVGKLLWTPQHGVLWPFRLHATRSRGQPVVRLGLRFGERIDSGIVFRIPWELAAGIRSEAGSHPARAGRVHGVEPDVSVVRYWLGSPRTAGEISAPLRLGVLKGHPGEGSHRIDLDGECADIRKLVEGLRDDSPGLVELAEGWASESGIHRLAMDSQILVFLGHGTEEGGEVRLEIVREDPGSKEPRRRRMSVGSFAGLLTAGGTPVRLVILNACSGAGSLDAYEQGALALLEAGVGAVVAIQGKIKVEAARLFTWTLLQHLLEGRLLDQAVLAGRQAVERFERDNFQPKQWGDWARPVLLLGSRESEPFALAPEFQPLARRRRRRWRERFPPPGEPPAGAETWIGDLRDKAGRPGVFGIVERDADRVRPLLGAALGALVRAGSVPVPLYDVDLPEQASSPEPILARLREQALTMEDPGVVDDAQYGLEGHREDLRGLRFPYDGARILVLTGCGEDNRPAWEPFAALGAETGLDLSLLLVGSPAVAAGGDVSILDPPPTPGGLGGAGPVPDLERLDLVERQVLETLACLRRPASPMSLVRILEETRVLAALPRLHESFPGLLETGDAGWRLAEPARAAIAAGLSRERAVLLHRRAAGVFLGEAQD